MKTTVFFIRLPDQTLIFLGNSLPTLRVPSDAQKNGKNCQIVWPPKIDTQIRSGLLLQQNKEKLTESPCFAVIFVKNEHIVVKNEHIREKRAFRVAIIVPAY